MPRPGNKFQSRTDKEASPDNLDKYIRIPKKDKVTQAKEIMSKKRDKMDNIEIKVS